MMEARGAPGWARTHGSRRGRGFGGLVPSVLVLLLALPAGTLAQQTRVSGTVTSAETGQALAGVNVVVKGTSIGMLTNSSGQYTIQVPSAEDTLVFSMIGFADAEEPIAGRSVVDAVLDVQAVALQEIVVTGYGTQQRRDVTGSVQRVAGDELTEIATPSVAQSMQGKVAGVQVIPASGEPGQDAVVRIRGVGTLNDASPLYVVDGMLLDDISFLNPADVQSMDVLKDASATAIYGSRGANGVIILTTKRGLESRRTTYNARAYVGTQRVLNKIDMVDAQQYAMLANELAANLGTDPYFDNPNAVGPGTDWQDAIFQNALIQNYQISASGGTDRITYYFSANLADQEGIIDRSDYQRVTVRVNNDYQLSDNITVGHNLNFSHTEDLPAPDVYRALYYADPAIAPTDAEGNFNDANIRSTAGNPAAAIFYTNRDGEGDRLVGNVYGQATFLDNFSFRTSFGLDYDRREGRQFLPVYTVSPTQQNPTSRVNVDFDNTDSWLWENTLTYNYNTEQHRVTVLGGITAQSFYFEEVGGARTNVVGENPALWYLNAGDADGQTNYNTAEDWKMLSYLFRTNYTFRDRYLFTGSLRVDGSSRFGEENRYGYFPSVALGWDVAQEEFLSGFESLSALKLRASWGQIGNDKIGAYPGIPVVSGNLNAVFGGQQRFGASPVALANPEVKWEKTTQMNLGVDAAFFGGRLETTLEYYNRLTDGILVQVPIPRYVGVTTQPFVNAAEVENSGFEGQLTWYGNVAGVAMELNLNGSTINNEVKELGGGREEILGGGLGNEVTFTTRTVVGEPIGSFWGFRTDGVFQNQAELDAGPRRGGEVPGDIRYVDTNGDGVITDADKTFLGSPIPDFVYGIDTNFRWQAFDLGLGFSGQMGNEVFNGKKAVRFGVENFETSYLDRWHGEGTSTTEPRVTNAGHNYQASDRWIEDGSFFKLHSAQLGYRLPQTLSQRMGVDMARIYVSGTNLFLVTDYSGYTPELVDRNNPGNVLASGIDLGVYPVSRIFTVGLDLTF